MRNVVASRSLSGLVVIVAACGEAPPLEPTSESTAVHQEPITGGQVESGFPAVGCLRMASSSANDCNCTGSLIAPNLVLTAKHCGFLTEFRTGTLVSVPQETRAVVERIQFHPEDEDVEERDLQVLRLDSPIFTIPPLRINTGSVPANGTSCVTVGWGLDDFGKTGTKKSATVNVVDSGPLDVAIWKLGIQIWVGLKSAVETTPGLSSAAPPGGRTQGGDSGAPLLCNGVIVGANQGDWDPVFDDHDYFTAIESAVPDFQSAVWVTNVAADYVNEPLVSVASWGSNRLDIFVRGTDGALWTKVWDTSLPLNWDNSHWYPSQFGWWSHGGFITGTPEAVSWGQNRIDVFVRGGDPDPKNNGLASQTLWHHFWDGSNWHWQHLGGPFLIGHPSAVTRPNRIDVFAVGADGGMYHFGGDGQTLTWRGVPSEDEPPQFLGPVKAFSTAPNHVDVYAVSTDGLLWHNHVNTASPVLSWLENWEYLGGPVRGAPTVASMAPGRQDIFVTGTDKAVWTKILDNGTWLPSQQGFWYHGGSVVGSPAVASLKPNWLTLVASGSGTTGNVGTLYKGWFNGSQWAPTNTSFYSLGGIINAGSPTLLSIPSLGVDMFTVAYQFTPYVNFYSPNGPQPFGWTPFGSMGGTVSW